MLFNSDLTMDQAQDSGPVSPCYYSSNFILMRNEQHFHEDKDGVIRLQV
jgi:hypothetical protein